jgi:hypothetical protein
MEKDITQIKPRREYFSTGDSHDDSSPTGSFCSTSLREVGLADGVFAGDGAPFTGLRAEDMGGWRFS